VLSGVVLEPGLGFSDVRWVPVVAKGGLVPTGQHDSDIGAIWSGARRCTRAVAAILRRTSSASL
jgi:hypothetical protein